MSVGEKAAMFMRALGRQAYYDAETAIGDAIRTMYEIGPEMGLGREEIFDEIQCAIEDAVREVEDEFAGSA